MNESSVRCLVSKDLIGLCLLLLLLDCAFGLPVTDLVFRWIRKNGLVYGVFIMDNFDTDTDDDASPNVDARTDTQTSAALESDDNAAEDASLYIIICNNKITIKGKIPMVILFDCLDLI
ncbi:hypothetical protein HNY73_007429 [Argiope bruennichi]|uniref:Uncharacterized protein n=1 Tax=Argiope bruennichi TaxID=94029 RepID=A0A8T0FEJ4_ARGBR|nr:hypothetical protein HNY73_007429 [Argiope bruennichi]